jgi:two-component system, NarL family, nitrate/nitrite response regulator NarL
VRLVLCDDNKILCDALQVALDRRGHSVVATANTTVLGIAAVAAHRPAACLLDLRFPDPPDGLEAAGLIRRRYPETAVLILSGFADQEVRAEAMRLGVAGFLRKDQDVGHVADALDVIAGGGEIYDSVRVTRERSYGRVPGCQPTVLTPREREVLRRMAAGQSTAQMSREMDIEVSTLRTYVKNVLTKLGAHSRLQAVAMATREHLFGGLASPRRGAVTPYDVGPPRQAGVPPRERESEARGHDYFCPCGG